MDLWPHQLYAVDATIAAIASGNRRICLTSPTGGGKTRTATVLTERWLADGHPTIVYTNRRLLLDQLSDVFQRAGLDHGIRAAGHAPDHGAPLQISSLQTEAARTIKAGTWSHFPATRVIIDEAHLQTGKSVFNMLARHLDDGAALVGLTATPLDLEDIYHTLIIAGTNSELRKCGALVPCFHYGPDEPDLKTIGRVEAGHDLSEPQNVRAIMRHGVFGRVIDNYRQLNPEGRPTVLFAPGVPESVWFAKEFVRAGIPAASIDGSGIWWQDTFHPNSPESRAALLDASRAGIIKVICNRFVLREGIDAPWLSHGIFACVFGSLKTYLQAGGRLLRASPGKASATIQDHGGNWWRHGSLNADRSWDLSQSCATIARERVDRMREDLDPEPMRCPQCGLILVRRACPCGYQIVGSRTRPVVQTDGTLIDVRGDIIPPRYRPLKADTQKLWLSMYYRARNSGMTFTQAEGLFARTHRYWPPRTLRLMPQTFADWYRRVVDVPKEQLI